MTTRTLFFIFAFLLVVSLANASDERSIKDLAKALTGLSSDGESAAGVGTGPRTLERS